MVEFDNLKLALANYEKPVLEMGNARWPGWQKRQGRRVR